MEKIQNWKIYQEQSICVEEIHVSELEGLDHRFLHSSQQSKVKHNFKDILGVVCPKGRTS